jgi:Flagellar biosynthesis protein, FliO
MKSKNQKIKRERASMPQLAPVAGPQCSHSFEQELRQSLSRLPGRGSLTQVLSWARRYNSASSDSSVSSATARAWKWLSRSYRLSTIKRLRVAETVSLGEKRFVAILNVDGCDFLIGGGTAGVSLLAHMEKPIGRSGEALEMVKVSGQ